MMGYQLSLCKVLSLILMPHIHLQFLSIILFSSSWWSLDTSFKFHIFISQFTSPAILGVSFFLLRNPWTLVAVAVQILWKVRDSFLCIEMEVPFGPKLNNAEMPQIPFDFGVAFCFVDSYNKIVVFKISIQQFHCRCRCSLTMRCTVHRNLTDPESSIYRNRNNPSFPSRAFPSISANLRWRVCQRKPNVGEENFIIHS